MTDGIRTGRTEGEAAGMTCISILNAQLFDGRRLRKGLWDVTCEDGIIWDVRPSGSSPRRRDGVRILDGSGCTLLPGLIDLHVHISWAAGDDPAVRLVRESPARSLLRATSNARITLDAGITTIRDLGSPDNQAIELARAIGDGIVVGPRIVSSGRTIIKTGGHDPFWGIMVDGPYEARKAARAQIFAGAGVIKVSATGGAYGRPSGESVDDVELLPDELAEIAHQAHQAHLRVAAHAIGETGIQNCLDAGVDTIEHGQFLTEAQADMMAKRGAALIPTVYVYRRLADAERVPPYAREKARAIVERHRLAVAIARAAGVPIGAGTDAGSVATPHPSLVDEIELLHEYGLTREEALASATGVAAEILGGAGEGIGNIEAGCTADLILVRGNPCEDFNALRNPSLVVKGGTIVRGALTP